MFIKRLLLLLLVEMELTATKISCQFEETLAKENLMMEREREI